MSQVYKLEFEVDNPCNTTIVDSNSGQILYEVVTEHGEDTVTRVCNSAGETIASWVWREVRSDLITLGNGTPVSVGVWLRKSLVPLKNTVTFEDHTGRKFKWKGNGPGLSFELYSEDNKKDPLVRFQKSRTIWNRTVEPPTSTVQPAYLLMDNRGREIQDVAVVSFLVLEKSRRVGETATLNRSRSSALGGALGAVGSSM